MRLFSPTTSRDSLEERVGGSIARTRKEADMSIGEVTNVQAAFEMLLEEIEAEIELTTRG